MKTQTRTFSQWVKYAQYETGCTGELPDDAYDYFYEYYTSTGEMPYGVAKARTGDPYNWLSDKIGQLHFEKI